MDKDKLDFPLDSLKPSLERMVERQVPHSGRILALINQTPGMKWTDLCESDQAIVRGWSLHLVGMLRRIHGQLVQVKSIVAEASHVEKTNAFLSSDDLVRIAEHHAASGRANRANVFRLAAALRTPAGTKS